MTIAIYHSSEFESILEAKIIQVLGKLVKFNPEQILELISFEK